MEMKRLKSSQIWAAGYDPETKTLRVQFTRHSRDGKQRRLHPAKTAEYSDVTPEVFEELCKTQSPGRYFAASVKPAFKFTGYADVQPEDVFEEVDG